MKEKKKITLDCKKERTEEIFVVTEKYGTRSAKVYFENGKFKGCTYVGVASQYSLQDWRFLNALSVKIMEMTKGEK